MRMRAATIIIGALLVGASFSGLAQQHSSSQDILVAVYPQPKESPGRVFRKPPAKTIIQPWQSADRIIIKFAEQTEVRIRGGQLKSLRGVKLGALNSVLAGRGVRMSSIAPLFDRPEQALAADKVRGEQRRGRKLADLSLYYSAKLKSGVDAAALCDALNALAVIESAVPAPLPLPPPVDIPPFTPDFTNLQGYRALVSGGIGIDEVSGIEGTDGSGTAFVDVEYGWILDHEDLEIDSAAVIYAGATINPYDPNHGTAVLGILVGRPNAYGVTGLVPAATPLLSPQFTEEHGNTVARAINDGAAQLSAGDVILLETQSWVCGGNAAFGPSEWNQPVFDAVQTATALGIVVVAGAGNGYGNGAQGLGVDLDSPDCGGLFDRSVRDSGAIVVGAGEAGTRNKTGFSSYGSRVDVQGWGDRTVMTTGFGDHFMPEPADELQAYTAQFSGTSSAAPMVVAAVLAVQGARLAAGQPPLDSYAARDLLTSTGIPQGTGGHIGPLPSVPAALAATLNRIAVSIDLDPWDQLNEVDPGVDSLLTVAVHTTTIAAGGVDFDATDIDPTSLRFGPAAALNKAVPLVLDVDGDTDIDTVFGFGSFDTGIACGDTDATLTGATYSGVPLTGSDAFITTNCGGVSCHP
jgi:serine protease